MHLKRKWISFLFPLSPLSSFLFPVLIGDLPEVNKSELHEMLLKSLKGTFFRKATYLCKFQSKVVYMVDVSMLYGKWPIYILNHYRTIFKRHSIFSSCRENIEGAMITILRYDVTVFEKKPLPRIFLIIFPYLVHIVVLV